MIRLGYGVLICAEENYPDLSSLVVNGDHPLLALPVVKGISCLGLAIHPEPAYRRS